jgi:hypothetical protein
MSKSEWTAAGRVRKARPVWAIAFVIALFGLFSLSLGTATRAFADPSNAGGVSIDAGGSGDGGSFAADEYYSGGSTASNTTGSNGDIDFSPTVAHPIPQADWNTYRYLATTYTIPALVPGGDYQVRLYFLDWYFTQTGHREFNVAINGTSVLSNFDIVQAAANAGGDGTYIGVEEDFTETADASGDITIAFSQGAENQPLVNAIAVVPDAVNADGVSIDAGGSGDGGSFAADEYYSSSLTASNTTGSNGDIDFSPTVAHPIPQADWNTYRYLANTYTIPDLTPGGSYQVRLYFLDWYFTQTGQREFNVAINGTAVLSNFDIVQAAANAGGDGDYIGVEEDFTETAGADGVITIAFTQGAENQPMVNAIAVVPSS